MHDRKSLSRRMFLKGAGGAAALGTLGLGLSTSGCAATAPGTPLAVTTNAVGLAHRAAGLAAAVVFVLVEKRRPFINLKDLVCMTPG